MPLLSFYRLKEIRFTGYVGYLKLCSLQEIKRIKFELFLGGLLS